MESKEVAHHELTGGEKLGAEKKSTEDRKLVAELANFLCDSGRDIVDPDFDFRPLTYLIDHRPLLKLLYDEIANK